MAQNPKCTPLNINTDIKIPILPIGIPGIGLEVNFGGYELPDLGLPEDIMNWVRRLKFTLPGGGFLQDIVNKLQQSVAELVSKLLGYLNSFLSFMMVIFVIAELLICIINVLCKIPNPFAVAKALRRLFRKCIPLFISVCLPFLALLLLILAVIAIIIALIEFIITMIKRLIVQLIANIKRLAKVLSTNNYVAALAIVTKLASLMCLFEHVFVLLNTITAILDIIISKFTGEAATICGSSSGSGGDNGLISICNYILKRPGIEHIGDTDYYKNIDSKNGEVLYLEQVMNIEALLATIPGLDPTLFGPTRPEGVVIKDDTLEELLKFKNIISSNDGNNYTFFPFSATISADTPERKVPYFVDMTFSKFNPHDGYGARNITIENVVVYTVLTSVIKTVTPTGSTIENNPNGYLYLTGGKTTDGYYLNQSIETLLRTNGLPANTSGVGFYTTFNNVSYTVKANYPALAEYMLITLDCMPDITVELDNLNATVGNLLSPSALSQIEMPDINTAVANMQQCLNTMRAALNEEAINTFSICMNDNLNILNEQAANAYGQAVGLFIDPYSATKTVSTDIQFIQDTIGVTITPSSIQGLTLGTIVGDFVPPASAMASVASKFSAELSLGSISDFSYDGYGNFVASISSSMAGDGEIRVYYDGNMIAKAVRPIDMNIPASIDVSPLTYSFVGAKAVELGFGDGYGTEKRDETDTSRD